MKYIDGVPHALVHKEREPEEYVFGANSPIPFVELNPSKDWTGSLPPYERQSPLFETYACTAFGTIGVIEILQIFLGLPFKDLSERLLAAMSGTKQGGNSPHTVAECGRKGGFVEEMEYPSLSAQSWAEYYAPVPRRLIKLAKKWLETHEFTHDWIPANPDSLYKFLKTSPIGVSVRAWYVSDDDPKLYVKPKGSPDTHWVLIVGAEYGKYWKIFDSYAPFEKKLAWDYDFGVAKRYALREKQGKDNWLRVLILKIINLFK